MRLSFCHFRSPRFAMHPAFKSYCVSTIRLLSCTVLWLPALSAASRIVPCAPNGQVFNPEHPYNCTITTTEHDDGTEDVRIDQPYVNGPFFEYKSILFKPSD